MARIRFEPTGREIEVPPGTSLYEAAREAGLPVGSACGAEGICGRCGLVILEGAGRLSPPEALERRVAARRGLEPEVRLSCLARVHGPVRATAPYWGGPPREGG